MEVVAQLKQDGIEKGLCRLWQMKLKSGLSVAELSDLYIRGINFCVSEDYPTLDFMRSNFRGQCEPYGIYIDDEVTGVSNIKDAVLNGDCKAMLEYDGVSVSRIYARHNTQASVNVSDDALVTIDAFDNSKLVIATSGKNAMVIVNLYGNAKAKIFGNGISVNYMKKIVY